MTTTFLRLCLNSPRDPQALAAAQALAGGLDWAGVARQAQAASLEALLYQQLKPHDDLLPPAVAAAWQAAYRYNAQRQLYLAHQLGQALAALNAAGVPVLLLKGAALAHTLYDHPAGRPFRDLDLLIRPGQTTAAFATLRQLGYTPHHPEPHPGVTRQFENEMLWQRPGPIVTYLDLHWQLLDSPHYQARLDSTWLWQTAVTSTPASLPFALRHLGPEAQLLHLCAHLLLHHGGQELLWRNDIAAHLYHTQATLDWDLLLRQAARSDLLLPLQTLLPDLAAQWAAPVPAGVLARDEMPGRVVAQRIAEANAFAIVDPYRAATHNKGIMNGIDAICIATGNDWRAIEAGAHAYAARSGQYRALTDWHIDDNGDLSGEITLPMAVGTVGGATRVHPTAQVAMRILNVSSASELGQIMAAVGLAQNLAALRALVTEGIQAGHMSLHARQIAIAAGAAADQVDWLAARLISEGQIRVEKARELLAALT